MNRPFYTYTLRPQEAVSSGMNQLYSKEQIMEGIIKRVRRFIEDESGLTTVEYAVAGALVAATVVAAFQALGLQVEAVIESLTDAITPGGTV